MSGGWLWTAIVLPLVLAGATVTDRRGRWAVLALPVAAVPALAVALGGGASTRADWLLLEVALSSDPLARVFLAGAALLWIAAGMAAHGTLTPPRRRFAALGLLALGANVTLVLAADAVTFYAGFAVMTFAAYGLVVHDGTAFAHRAGRAYLVMSVLGEMALLAGVLLAVHVAGTAMLDALPAAVAGSEHRGPIVGLLLVGLGVKAGLAGLHMWLPLAHPAAPAAASALLSGAMIKAGLLGWLRLLPLGEAAMTGAGGALVGLGLVGVFGAVAVGLTQRAPKVNLAYSSVSQIGLAVTVVGLAIAEPAVAPAARSATAVFALHHGMAKGALFLIVGTLRGRAALAGTALAAAALAGAPLTSGFAAKALFKDVAEAAGPLGAAVVAALPWTSVATALLMARLLWLQVQRAPLPLTRWSWVGSALALAGALTATWGLPAARAAGVAGIDPGAASALGEATWPLLVAAVPVALALLRPVRVPELPAGDVLRLVTPITSAAWNRRASVLPPGPAATGRRPALPRPVKAALADATAAEAAMTRWQGAGAVLAVVLVVLLWAVAR